MLVLIRNWLSGTLKYSSLFLIKLLHTKEDGVNIKTVAIIYLGKICEIDMISNEDPKLDLENCSGRISTFRSILYNST